MIVKFAFSVHSYFFNERLLEIGMEFEVDMG